MQQYAMLALAAGLTVVQPALAEDNDTRDAIIEELRSEVADLKDTVAELKAASSDNWLTEQRADEIRGLVEDVLADADTRASLLQDGATAGWDGSKFFLASADGNWRLTIAGQLQVRWALNNAAGQAGATPAQPNTLYGFEVRRAKVKFGGHVVDPSWQYALNLAVDHDDSSGAMEVEDAWIAKAFDNGITLTGGQYKLQFDREELVSSTSQQAVDRSVVNEFFNVDRSQGVKIEYACDQFRVFAIYSDGAGNRWGGYDNGSAAAANAVTGRIEWLAAGNWKQFKDFQGWKGQTYGAMIGAAIHYQASKYGMLNAPPMSFSTPRTQRLAWTVDASVEGDGWNVFAYVVGNHLSDNAPGSMSADQIGFVVQGAYMLTEDWDVYGRYEWGDLDNNGSASMIATALLSDISIITVGTNYYVDKQRAKWTTDIGFGLRPVPTNAGTGVDWRADVAGNDGQFVFRTQFQLLF